MKLASLVVGVVTLFAVVPVATHPGDSVSAATDVLCIEIQVSPATVVLDSEGTWVTVHAELDYGLVDTVTVTLNDIPVKVTKADDRGDLVAKFLLDDVKEILEPGDVALWLRGTTKDDVPFEGMDVIRVVKGGRD